MEDIAYNALLDFIAKHNTQTAAAKKLGYSVGFVNNLVRRCRPVPETIYPKIGVVKILERIPL
jgi:hypothetical protein